MAEIPTRVMLTEEDFYQLCCGRTVKHDGVEIAIQDIGHQRMLHSLSQISDGRGRPLCDRDCSLKTFHYGACMT
jgi:hypothetical protein